MEQIAMFDDNPLEWLDAYVEPQPIIDHHKSLDEQFDEYHRQNPHVLHTLIRMTDRVVANGHRCIGMSLLVNQLRWESMISTTGDEYKLNNNFNSRYVRLIEQVRPDLIGVFNKRELRS